MPEHADVMHEPVEDTLMLDHPHTTVQQDMKGFIKELIDYWDTNINKHFKKKRDIDIANAILELFKRCQNIEDFNKKALYLMIREMTNHKTTHITKVINKMKLVVNKQLKNYHSYGLLDSRPETPFFKY